MGSEKAKVLPFPEALFTQMRPPWASTIPFAIASPSPAPPRRFRVVCQKRSKILSRSVS